MEINEQNRGQYSIRNMRNHFSKIGWIYFAGSLLMFLAQMIIMKILWLVIPQYMSDTNVMLIASSLSSYVIAVPLLVWMLQRVPKTELPKKQMNFGRWILAFLMSYTLMYVTNVIGLFVTNIIGNIKGSPVQNPIEHVIDGISPITAVIVMVIMAPVVEEILFRKVLLDRVVEYGEGMAILLSGLMFGAMHGNLNQFAYAFGLGVFFAFIYIKTGKLRYTIFLHATINFMGSIPGIVMMQTEAFEKLLAFDGNVQELGALLAEHGQVIVLFYAYLILVGGLVIAGLVCWVIHFRKMHCQTGILAEMGLKNRQKFAVVVINIGMLLYLIFWMIQMGIQALE